MCKEWKQDVDEARAEGIASGMEKGRKEGHASGVAQTKLETAKAMLKKGFSHQDIVDCTGLSSSEIAALIG